MKKQKLAIFIDLENLRKDIIKRKKFNTICHSNFDYNNSQDLFDLIQNFIESDEEICRIFIYTSKPMDFDQELKNLHPNSTHHKRLTKDISLIKQSPKYQKRCERNKKILELLEEIATRDFVALRLGKLRYCGLGKDSKGNDYPILEQKQVDMLMGLDIAHISYNKLADRILIFCKDTDIIPALKCARTNGLRVEIANLKNGIHLSKKIKEHSDKIRDF